MRVWRGLLLALAAAAADPRDGVKVGQMVSFEAVNIPRHYVSHSGWEIGIYQYKDTENYQKEATWRVLSPMYTKTERGERCFSFESQNMPGYYLRMQFHQRMQRMRIVMHEMPQDANDDWKKATTWCLGISPNKDDAVTFKAAGDTMQHIRHEQYVMYVDDMWQKFNEKHINDASFFVRPAVLDEAPDMKEMLTKKDVEAMLPVDRKISIEALHFPGHYLSHTPIDPKIQIHTPGNNKYYEVPHYTDDWKDVTYFHVASDKKVYVALFGEEGIKPGKIIEIMLSKDAETSTVRKGNDLLGKTEGTNDFLQDSRFYRQVYIKVGRNSVEAGVGKMAHEEMRMRAYDVDTSWVTGMAVMTMGGTKANWMFDSTEHWQVLTANDGQYRYVTRVFEKGEPSLEKGISFSVQAKNDAHIGLFPAPTPGTRGGRFGPRGTGHGFPFIMDQPFYEIVLSGWGNKQSVIRRGSQQANLVAEATGGLLSEEEMRTFVIQQAKDGTVRVYKEEMTKDNLFMEWKDPNPLEIVAIGCMTGWGAEGKWRWPELGTLTVLQNVDTQDVTDFYKRATWIVRDPLVGKDASCRSFESADQKGAYMRTMDNGIITMQDDNSDDFGKAATVCAVASTLGRGIHLSGYDDNASQWMRARGGRVRLEPSEMIKSDKGAAFDALFDIVDGLTETGDKDRTKNDDDDDKTDDKSYCGYTACKLSGKPSAKLKGNKLSKRAVKDEHLSCTCKVYCQSKELGIWALAAKGGKKPMCQCFEITKLKKAKKVKNSGDNYVCSEDPTL